MIKTELPLIGLLNEVILPHETRECIPPAIDAATCEALENGTELTQLVALCVTSQAELPALITARWATVCRIVVADKDSVTLEGQRRVRVLSASGKKSPYSATVEEVPEEEDNDAAEMAREAHRLIAALQVSMPRAGVDSRVHTALGELVRSLRSIQELKKSLEVPAAESMRCLAEELASQAQGTQAECELEAALRELAGRPKLPKAMRHRLWAQVVGIQRRLDVHDANLADSGGDEVAALQRRLSQAGLPKLARITAKRELRTLRSLSETHHDYVVKLGHLRFMAQLPWHPTPPSELSIERVENELNREHTGLDKAKQRVLEYFAVRTLGGEARATVLCFVGPPGVGKTSMGRAIARALDRPFVRVALGGVHDECEIRGHRLSFVAAAPGSILKAVADAAHLSEDDRSPVILLDEIDKVSTARDRSPAAALLEVLDPEQNSHFRDNYLGVPYDLSPVLFICTANDLDAILPTLRDRLEIVELDGYSVGEKREIAKRHLSTRTAEDCGLPEVPELSDQVLDFLIEGYTREAGVRQLARTLASLFRARALAHLRQKQRAGDSEAPALRAAETKSEPGAEKPEVEVDEVESVLGPPRYRTIRQPDALPVGVATGLSVGPHGGSKLFIEVARTPGKGELRLTGRLGDIMRESAYAALTRLRMMSQHHGLDGSAFEADFHVHVPEGATAKDGPSAGIALFAAFLSAARGVPIRADVAMSGEVTLSGNVLAVGGVRQKLLAAERAGIRKVVLPALNRADVSESLHRDLKLDAVFAGDLDEVVAAVFDGGFFAPSNREYGPKASNSAAVPGSGNSQSRA